MTLSVPHLPIQQPVTIFLLVLLIILLAPLLFKRIKVPQLVGLIIAGMIVGPYGFNLLDRDASFKIFGEVGILYIMFLAAVEIDMYHFRQNARQGVIFGLLSFGLPMAVGIFGARYAFNISWSSAVLIASMYASHTLISYPTVSRFGLSGSRGALVAVGGTIVAVLLALLALAEVIAVKVDGFFDPLSLIELFVMMGIYMVVVGYGFPWLTRRFFSRFADPVMQFIFILSLVFIASQFANFIGLEAILGAFYAGLVLNRLIPERSGLMKNIRFVGNAIFIPYFLIGVGMLINIGVIIKGWNVVWVAVNMVVVALGTKWLATWIAQKMFRMTRDDRNLMFGLTSGKAAATIAATMIGIKYELLTEDVMNGAVVMILVCCIIASVFTERSAKRIRMHLLEEDGPEERDMEHRTVRPLVSVANPYTADGLMRLALLTRHESETSYMPVLYVRTGDDKRQMAAGRVAMRSACSMAQTADVEVKEIIRYDLNVASGMVSVSKEENASEFIVGMHHRANMVDSFYGATIEQLIDRSDSMIMILRSFTPVDAVNRLVVVAGHDAEYETGFAQWVDRVATMGAQIDARLIFIATKTTGQAISTFIEENQYPVRHEVRRMDNWDDFILHSSEIGDDDLLVTVLARKGSISSDANLDSLPGYISRHFAAQNLLIIYPRQFKTNV